MATQPGSVEVKRKRRSVKRFFGLGVLQNSSVVEANGTKLESAVEKTSPGKVVRFATPCSATTSSSVPEQYGMFKFQDKDDDAEGVIDIVAVHGLGGHYDRTWTWDPPKSKYGRPCNWLRDLLPDKIPNARIMSFGYNSAVALSKSIGDVSTFGEQLLMRVRMERRSEMLRKRPIVFVCHSLGGIVVKKALILANEQRGQKVECRELLDSIQGIIFMGTPHRGSATASLGAVAGNMLRAVSGGTNTNTALIKQLKQNSKALQEISNAFAFLGAEFKIYTFIETNRMDWINDVVVTQDSARLNMPNEEVFMIEGDHSSICKFPGESQNYGMVASVLVELIDANTLSLSRRIASRKAFNAFCTIMDSALDVSVYTDTRNETVRKSNLLDFEWFFTSPEFADWKNMDSLLLWLSGAPQSGKTSLSYILWDRLLHDQTYSQEDQTTLYVSTGLIPSGSTIPVYRLIVFTLIGQILRSVILTDPLCKRRCIEEAEQVPVSTAFTLTDISGRTRNYWNILHYLLITTDRNFSMIIDGIDMIQEISARKAFIRGLRFLLNRVNSKRVGSLRVLVISKPYEDIKEELQNLPYIERDKERQACLQTLRFVEFNARRALVEQAHEQTCKWLEDDEGYTNWDNSKNSSLLIIRGKPGSGKSTLAKEILNRKKAQYGFDDDSDSSPRQRDVLMADFFYSYRGGNKQTTHSWMLQSLLYQLLDQDERLFPLFQGYYRAQRSEVGIQWKFEDLRSILRSLVSLKTSHKIYILLDAMDESVAMGRTDILKLISELCVSHSDCVFKCLVATRPLPAGEIDERNDNFHLIIMQNKNWQAIQTVIHDGVKELEALALQLQTFEDESSGPPIELAFAADYMSKHAHGVFLWAVLVLQELRKLVLIGPSQHALECHLDKLPTELEDMYRLIINQLVNQTSPVPGMPEKARKMLAWVTFAERPLRAEEFCDAIATTTALKPFTPDCRYLVRNRVRGLERHIRSYCGPLLEVRDSIVQLFHLTVREYLLREDMCAAPFDMNEEIGHTEITLTCIRYLRLILGFKEDKEVEIWDSNDYGHFVKWLSDHPLLDYVVTYLVKHMKMINLEKVSTLYKELSLFVQEVQHHKCMSLLLSQRMENLKEVNIEVRWPEPTVHHHGFKIKCLITAVERSSSKVVELLANLGTDINGIDKATLDFALLVATRTRNLEVAKLLVKLGADVHLKNEDGWSAARWAAKEGYLPLLKCVSPKGEGLGSIVNGTSEIMLAAGNGHTSVMEYLVEQGVDVDAKDNSGRSALLLAAQNGHIQAFIYLLVETEANVQSTDSRLRTALHLAVEEGHKEFVYEMLNRRVRDCVQIVRSIDQGDSKYQTPLHLAVINGHDAIVKLLVGRTENLDAQDISGKTALVWAAMTGRVTATKYILRYSTRTADSQRTMTANQHLRDSDGRIALHYAIQFGYDEIADLLLRDGDPPMELMIESVRDYIRSRHRYS